MNFLFPGPEQLIKEDSPRRLVLARLNKFKVWGGVSLGLAAILAWATVALGINWVGGIVVLLYLGLGLWLVTSRSTITFDIPAQVVYFSTHHLLLERKGKPIPFADIAAVYLDYEEQVYHSARTIYVPKEKVRRKWYIFLVLKNKQTVTIARHWSSYPLAQAPVLSKQTVAWENLAEKICAATDKLLVRTPSVPGRAPYTFVDVINQIVQRRLAALPPGDALNDRTVRLRSHPNGTLEIIVNGVKYGELGDVPDLAVRNLIQAAVEEWQSFAAGSVSESLAAVKEAINISRSKGSA